MDYNKLWSLINKENLSKRAAAKVANMSPYGFNMMMERKTMSVETLELLAKHFGVPVNYFFEEEEQQDLLNDPESEYSDKSDCDVCRDKDVEIRLLNRQMKEKEEKIYELQKAVGALEQQLHGGNDSNGNGSIPKTG